MKYNFPQSYSGWTIQDDYFCAFLFPQAGDFYTHAMQYHCKQLSEKFPQSCVFEQENHIVVLINASLSDTTVQSFQNEIAIYLRDGLMKAGISSTGHDLNEFTYYHQQALQTFPVHFLYRPELDILHAYDQEHSSMLEKTLRCYLLNERALLRTAELLDIHRTTLLYRIRRIEELTGLQLDDDNTRFDLLLSFRLMDMAEH